MQEPVADDIINFANEQLSHSYGDTCRLIEWVDSRSLKSKNIKKRVIVMGTYRILSIKRGKLGLSLNHEIHFYDLNEIVVTEGCVELRARNQQRFGIIIRSSTESLQKLVYHIRNTHRYMTHSFPSELRTLKLNGSAVDTLTPLPEKVIGPADGFSEVYKGLCNYKKSPPSTEVCRLVTRYYADRITDFDLNKCPGIEGKGEMGSVEHLFQALENNLVMSSAIEYLNLSTSKFEDVGSSVCGRWIYKVQNNYSLRRLYLSSCQLHLIYLGSYLKQLCDIKTMDLSKNKLEKAEIEEINSLLSRSNGLEVFNLSGCNINNEEYSLRRNENIKILKLDANFSGSPNEGIEFISEVKSFLSTKKSLTTLSLAGCQSNHLTQALLKPLFMYLEQEENSLECLNIGSNMLGDLASVDIANMLEKNDRLKSLEVDNNLFTINAYQTIMLALQNNRSLVNFSFPSVDFERAISMLPTNKKCLLFSVIHKIQAILEENGLWYEHSEHYYPTPTKQTFRPVTVHGGVSNSNPNTPSSSFDIKDLANLPPQQQPSQQLQQQQRNGSIGSNSNGGSLGGGGGGGGNHDSSLQQRNELNEKIANEQQLQHLQKLRSQTKLTPRSLVDSIDIVMATLQDAGL
ncbi:leucine-rich repeat-containing protein [Cavenderia fasciculata]|uniref:Leucine-rich repeat-containing protein n=1 Tax=Cavenderia fasciculata TaxID=261658 RepID=F4PXQ9_CACFS|nr:leucine-rich repeat-containing protein [Cavenderia fasciculata]EGG19569.1 leucine-rich repeat-containing protein [Cavenderia fasciculata]|eukprot:XP_004357863.1 leucine-rich repeat-containing protein [Cavenderia fasciculata]